MSDSTDFENTDAQNTLLANAGFPENKLAAQEPIPIWDESDDEFLAQEKETNARRKTNSRPDITPERQAEAIDLSKYFKSPVALTERNLDKFKNSKHEPFTAAPSTLRLMDNPDLAPAIKDDLDNLSWWEMQTKSMSQSFDVGQRNVELSEIGYNQMFGDVTDQDLARGIELDKLNSEITDYDHNFVSGILPTGAEQLPIMGQILWGAREETLAGAGLGFLAGSAIPGVGNVGGTLAMGGAGFKIGTTKEAFKLESGLAYREYMNMKGYANGVDVVQAKLDGIEATVGMDSDTARGAATAVGLLNAGLEVVSLNYILKTIPGGEKLLDAMSRKGVKELMKNPTIRDAFKKFGKGITKVSAVEGGTEGLQELLTTVGGIIAGEMAEGEFDVPTVAEVLSRVSHATVKGMQGGIALGGLGQTATLGVDVNRVRKVAAVQKKFLEDLGEVSSQSKTRERLSAEFQGIVNDFETVNGEVTQLFVAPEKLQTLFQDMAPEEMAEKMPEMFRQLNNNVTSSEIAIPLSEYATHIAPMDEYAEFLLDVRLAPDELTLREANAEMKNSDDSFAKQQGGKDSSEGSDSRVFDEMKSQLEMAGRDPKVADQEAMVWDQHFNAMGERMGVDPYQLYEEFVVSVNRSDERAKAQQGVDYKETIIDKIRSGKAPSDREIFGDTFGEMLMKRGGLRDEGGELMARDYHKAQKGLFGGRAMMQERGVSIEDAITYGIEEGYLPENMLGQGADQLLEILDNEARGEPIYTDNFNGRELSIREDMEHFEEVFAQMGIDVNTMSNEQIMDLLDDSTYFQSSYSELSGEDKKHVDQALEDVDDPDTKRRLLDEYAGTPWAKQAISGAKARAALKQMLSGKNPEFDNAFNAPQGAKLKADILANGEEAVWAYLEKLSIVGHPEKPVNSVNSSFLNCEPSPDCAAYCYAAKGRAAMSGNIRKAELVTWAVENNPIRAAKLTSRQYGAMAESMAGKALRLFDKGDGNSKWIPYIEELNRLGVRTHIFSKNAEFLSNVPDDNIKMLSIDKTNEDLAAANPDLDVAYVFSGSLADRVWLNDNKSQVQMILPVVLGKQYVPKAENAAIGKWARPKLCPIDKGAITLKDGWNCTRCDKGGGVGCYHGQTSEQTRLAKIPLIDILEEPGQKDIFDELKELENELGDSDGGSFLREELAALLLKVRSGIDEAGEGGTQGAIETAPKPIKKLQQLAEDGVSDTKDVYELSQTERGYIQFDEAKSFFQITLTENADLSTFLHESGHFFLESMLRLSSVEAAPQALRDDMASIDAWLGGVEDGTYTREQHEKFARGFESYLMEGKAPSIELMGAFERFKLWMLKIYKTFDKLDVELTDEVRGVFDRLLATPEQIEEASQMTGFAPLFEDVESSGMSLERFADYIKRFGKSKAQAQADLEKQMLAEVSKDARKIMAAAKKEAKKRITAEVEQMPEYAAAAHMRQNGLENNKMSSEVLKDLYGKIPPRLMNMYSPDGIHPDYIALQFGYGSGDEMIQAILKAPKKAELIAKRVDEEVKLDDSIADGSATEKAIDAVHGDMTSLFLFSELTALGARFGQKSSIRVIKAEAEKFVSSMRIMDLKPTKYRAAEKKFAAEAKKQMRLKNYPAAYEAKRKQLLNHHAFKAIGRAKIETGKSYKYLTRFRSTKVQQRLGKTNYRDAINTLLEGVEIKQKSLKELGRRKTLKEFVDFTASEEQIALIPPKLQHEMLLKNYKEMELGDFRALEDAVKNIDTLSKLKDKLAYKREKADRKAVVDQIRASTYENNNVAAESDNQNPSELEKAKSWVSTAHAHLSKIEFIVRWMDGETAGFAHKYIFQPFVDAQADKYDRMIILNSRLEAAFKARSRQDKARHRAKTKFMGKNMRGEDIIAAALNTGNQGNLDKLVGGYADRGWTAEKLNKELDAWMTESDWVMVQEIWDTVDSLWPDIEALNIRTTGLAPARVEPVPINNRHGTFRGGYYPVVYDPKNRSKKGMKQATNNDKKSSEMLFENSYMKPATEGGFNEERTVYVGPILLSLDVLPRHLNEVVHYLSHYEAVVAVDKITNDADFKLTIAETMGPEIAKQFRPWLQAIANDSQKAADQTYVDGVLRNVRSGMTVVSMGYKLSTVTMQLFGLLTTLNEIGIKDTSIAAGQMLLKPVETWKFANEQSGEVRHLMNTFDRDVKASIDGMFGRKKPVDNIKLYAFHLMGMVQKMVSVLTWTGAYNQATDKLKSREDAIRYADASMRMSQSSGAVKDLAAIQRGGEATQIFTMFYTYFSAMYGQVTDIGRNAKSGDAALAIAGLTYVILLPTLMDGLLKGKIPEEEDEWLGWFLKESALYAATTVPFGRDIASGAFGKFGYNLSPVTKFGKSAGKALGATGDFLYEGEEFSDSDWRAVRDVLGIIFKLPAGQYNATEKYIKEFDDVDDEIRELLVGVDREK